MVKNSKLKPSDIYNKTSIYNDKIDPIVRSLMAACIAEHMPMFVSVATENTKEETRYASHVVLGAASVQLSDNRIRSYILSLRKIGANNLPPKVQEALAVLEAYNESVKSISANSDSKSVGVKLKEDLMDDYCSIAGGGNRTVV